MFDGNRIYHVSENPNIRVFHPIPAPVDAPLQGNFTWGIKGDLVQNYLLPRNCPRICFYANAQTHAVDKQSFLSPLLKSHAVYYPKRFLPLIQSTRIYVYSFLLLDFNECIDEIAGYYISKGSIKPQNKQCIFPLDAFHLTLNKIHFEGLADEQLVELRQKVIQSTLAFSIIRWKYF